MSSVSNLQNNSVAAAENDLFEQARQVLQHVAILAPFGSHNIAAQLLDDSATARREALLKSKKLRPWFQHALTLQQQDRSWSEAHKHPACYADIKLQQLKQKLICDATSEQSAISGLPAAIAYAIPAYLWVQRTKIGVCTDLAGAAALYAYLYCDVTVTMMVGTSFQHMFLVLGEIPEKLVKKQNEFDITSLSTKCCIVDPWLRCKFTPDKAKIFWQDAAELFEWSAYRSKQFMVKVMDQARPDAKMRAALIAYLQENKIALPRPEESKESSIVELQIRNNLLP